MKRLEASGKQTATEALTWRDEEEYLLLLFGSICPIKNH